MKQHRDGVASYKPQSSSFVNVSGITKHASECTTGIINWDEPEVLATFQDKEMGKLKNNNFIRESLEIRKQETGPGKGLNDDYSKYVKTHAWDPILSKLRK
jgi:hypothetical protein